jgi:hypothetical protein
MQNKKKTNNPNKRPGRECDASEDDDEGRTIDMSIRNVRPVLIRASYRICPVLRERERERERERRFRARLFVSKMTIKCATADHLFRVRREREEEEDGGRKTESEMRRSRTDI